MTETTRTFGREAFSAAGPVFLVAMGLLLLSLLGVLALLGGLPAPVAMAFGAAGVAALVGGLAWGGAQRTRRPGRVHAQRAAKP